jgi:hypothetical protein
VQAAIAAAHDEAARRGHRSAADPSAVRDPHALSPGPTVQLNQVWAGDGTAQANEPADASHLDDNQPLPTGPRVPPPTSDLSDVTAGGLEGLVVEPAGRTPTGARRLGIKVMAGVLAAGLAAGLGAPEAARAGFSPAARITTATPTTATPTTATPTTATPTTATPTTGVAALRVMPLGDSITRGTGSLTRSSYRTALSERLRRGGMEINYVGSERDGSGTDIDHEGHGGWSIDELSERLDGWLAQARPDVVLLHAGTNNITQGDDGYTTARKLSAMLDQIRAARPEAYIFVAQIIGSRVPRELAQDRIYNRLIPGLVAEKVDPLITVVNQSTVAGIDLHDLHHPDDFGYSKMAYNWYQAMARVFGLSSRTGTNPYTMQSAYRCLVHKVVEHGKVRHRTECRTWKLRTVTVQTNGVNRRVRTWQTLRTVKQSYRVHVNGKVRTRTRLVHKWTGPGNLLDI